MSTNVIGLLADALSREVHFVIVSPSGAWLYWFGDALSAEAEARRLREAGPRG